MKITFIEEFKKLEIKFKTMTSEEVNDNEMENMYRLIDDLPDTKISGFIQNKFSDLVEDMYDGSLQYLPNSLLHWMSQCGYEV